MNKKFLITGAAGFVAKHFVEYLQKNSIKASVLGLDIAENVALPIEYKKVNLTNKTEIYSILHDFKPDYIVHFASISSVSQSWKEPVNSFVNNTNIFLNLVDSVRLLNLKTRILSIGSSEEYGNYPKEQMPLKETYQLHPDSPYSVARVSQEMLSKIYADKYGVDIVMSRSFNHIGPGQRDVFVIASFIKQLVEISKGNKEAVLSVGNVDVVRDFLDVRDVVDIYYKILTCGKIGEVYNVCSGNGLQLRKIIALATEELKVQVEICVDKDKIRPIDNMVIIGDNQKIRTEFNWVPKISIEQSIKDIISFWKETV